MSKPLPEGLSVDPDVVRAYVYDVLAKCNVDSVWVVGSRSRRKGKVPRPDSDWDLEAMGNVPQKFPLPAESGVFGDVQFVTKPTSEAVMLYPRWEYKS